MCPKNLKREVQWCYLSQTQWFSLIINVLLARTKASAGHLHTDPFIMHIHIHVHILASWVCLVFSVRDFTQMCVLIEMIREAVLKARPVDSDILLSLIKESKQLAIVMLMTKMQQRVK